MRFDVPARRTQPENIVPMINVVFLLLIFFLMTAQIAPPEPIEITPPLAELTDPIEGDLTLFLGPDGALAYEGARGEAALNALLSRGGANVSLVIKADAQVDANVVARLLPRLAASGFANIQLVTASP